MIISLLIGYLLYGSGGIGVPGILTSNDLEIINQRIAMEITDPVRAATATKIVSDVGKDLKRFKKVFNKTSKPLGKFYKDHDVGVEEMKIILDGLNEDWATTQQDIVDAHFAMKQTLTEDEWSRIYGQSAQSD